MMLTVLMWNFKTNVSGRDFSTVGLIPENKEHSVIRCQAVSVEAFQGVCICFDGSLLPNALQPFKIYCNYRLVKISFSFV